MLLTRQWMASSSRRWLSVSRTTSLFSTQAQQQALGILQSAQRLSFVSDELKEAISKRMTLQDVDQGHVFWKEGDELKQILVLEEGVLNRYKHGLEPATVGSGEEAVEQSILVDSIREKGRVAALWHSFEPGLKAYATVVAEGPAKVWTIEGQDFRDLLSSNGNFAMEVLSGLGVHYREESRISQALFEASHRGSDHDQDRANKQKAMRVLCYDSTAWVRNGFQSALKDFELDDGVKLQVDFTEERLGPKSAAYATGYDAVCTFVNDTANQDTIKTLSLLGVKMIAQRAAGFDRIDTTAARSYGMTVARVPAYSPYAVAEFAVSLLMSVNRKITKASSRVKLANFALDEGLMGIDVFGKTVGVMGTGKIGKILCDIMLGFGANVVAYDAYENEAVKKAGVSYVSKEDIFERCDIIFLMMPLLPDTKYTINMDMLHKLKKGVILINTSRGALVDTRALLEGLKSGQISGVGMDVYENEGDYFFQDWSARTIPDENLVALLGNHNVILTAHQAFFTQEAVDKIIDTTLHNFNEFSAGKTGLQHPNNCLPAIESGTAK